MGNTAFIRLLLLVLTFLFADVRTQQDPSNALYYPLPSQQRPDPTFGYDEQYAQLLLGLSAGAYALSPADCISRLFPAQFNTVLYRNGSQPCDDLGSQCSFYITVSDARREIIVVFRGTRNEVQLFDEGLESIAPGVDFYRAGQVNSYFYHGLQVLWPTIYTVLSDPRFSYYIVSFTGHSLGGALASLAAMQTVFQGLRRGGDIQLYTFGQPRISSASVAFLHDVILPNSYRVINGGDIVPHLPPCSDDILSQIASPCGPQSSGIAYHHGTEVWYSQGMPGPYRICRGWPRDEDYTCSDSLIFDVFEMDKAIDAHRHYFGHKVPAWGKLGCQLGVRAEEEAMPNDAVSAFRLNTMKKKMKRSGNGPMMSDEEPVAKGSAKKSGGIRGFFSKIIHDAKKFFG